MEESEDIAYLAASVCLCVLTLGVLVCYLLRACRVSVAFVPDSWVFLSIGVSTAAALEFGASKRLRLVVQAVDDSFSDIYFAALLPPVIFLAGLHLDLAGFFRRFTSICVFAFIGTFMSAVCIALPVFLFCLIPGIPHFNFVESFLLGSILSATDSGEVFDGGFCLSVFSPPLRCAPCRLQLLLSPLLRA
jgi:NhaP-type Na+/H+ or K+/H+ antiporter